MTPDLATFAKGIAAGFPLSALAGRREILDLITRGVVMHGGTYNTHPTAMAAANATVNHLECNRAQVYAHLFALGERLRGGLTELCQRKGVPVLLGGLGPVVQMAFTQRDAFDDYRDYLARDVDRYRRFVAALAERGVRTILRGTWYISAAHSAADIEETLERAQAALAAL